MDIADNESTFGALNGTAGTGLISAETLRALAVIDPVKAVHFIVSIIRGGEALLDAPIYESELVLVDKDVPLEDFTGTVRWTSEKLIGVFGLTLKLVHRHGGGEGEGEQVERVVAITDITGNELSYVEQTGFYSSDWGTEWDDSWVRVYPHEVKVIQYLGHP